MPERYNNITHKLFLRSKKIIKAIPSSITRIGLIIYVEDPRKVFNINYIHIKDTEAEETTIVNIITTSHPFRSNITSVINLDTNQASI